MSKKNTGISKKELREISTFFVLIGHLLITSSLVILTLSSINLLSTRLQTNFLLVYGMQTFMLAILSMIAFNYSLKYLQHYIFIHYSKNYFLRLSFSLVAMFSLITIMVVGINDVISR